MGNGAVRWVEKQRKEQEKLEVSPLGGGGEVSQSLLNGTWLGLGGAVRLEGSQGEHFKGWLLPSLPQQGRAEYSEDLEEDAPTPSGKRMDHPWGG